MEGLDPYEVLEVAPDAEEAEIRAAFQRLALLWHPDRCKEPDATRRFQLVQQAYELLSDPERRRLIGANTKVASERLDLSAFTYDESTCTYVLGCRCGGVYEVGACCRSLDLSHAHETDAACQLTSDDLSEGYDTVQCSGCSLHVTVS